jgi:predicted N-acyltransferase
MAGDGSLFTSAGYLGPLETHCATPAQGWTPAPVRLADGSCAPAYLKTHSWGEFVFDFEFAAAYQERGLRYYPKLVCSIPFTPVPGPRLLGSSDAARRALAAALMERASETSAHILFLTEPELAIAEALGFSSRLQLRYGWSNADYASFDEFLAKLSSKRRKNVKRERAALAGSGLRIEWRAAGEIAEDEWPRIHALYASTYEMRGQPPYLTTACLRAWARNFPQAMQLCLARDGDELIAMAFFFCDGDTLYGRHWGSAREISGLHFELCYYQGIDYAIRERLRRFDAGVQGEHRLLRGFEPELSYSAHWFAHRGFHGAIGEALARESAAIRARLELLREHSSYRDSS